MDGQFFACTLSRIQWVVTIGVMVFLAALVLAIFALLLATALATGERLVIVPLVVLAGIAALAFGGLFILAGYAPRGFVVDANGISIVRRNRKTVVLPAQEITSLTAIDGKVLDGCIRVWGTGGFFGSWGYFSCPKLGSFRAYMTNRESLVLIRAAHEGLLVVSPDSRADFIACAEKTFGLSPSASLDLKQQGLPTNGAM